MANPKTTKKRAAEMRKFCNGCKNDPDSCVYFKYRDDKNACIWRQPK